MLSANSMILLNSLFILEVLHFYVFATMQMIRFRVIDLFERVVLFDNDGVSTPGIASSLMLNNMELYKYAD